MKHRYTAAISLVITILIFSTIASAEEDKSNATTTTTIIDTDGYELVYLLTTNGEPVKIWIDSIEGNNGTEAHPIDAYIAQSDEYWDHFLAAKATYSQKNSILLVHGNQSVLENTSSSQFQLTIAIILF